MEYYDYLSPPLQNLFPTIQSLPQGSSSLLFVAVWQWYQKKEITTPAMATRIGWLDQHCDRYRLNVPPPLGLLASSNVRCNRVIRMSLPSGTT
mmetsp:Transcript_8086/g.23921  ORF Transcript_8086/g.23921 Transcript_8086/m.23921 type:complete len:93 (-) Transcript_8086:926-1204(-)